jgi:release factor glutamine methyltransferase
LSQTDGDVWTVGRLLQWTTDFLKQKNADSPRLDAEVLLAHALARPRIMLYASFGEAVPEEARGKFRDLVKRRGSGTPVAYLLGEKEFFSLPFEVTSATLIPRPETEAIVVLAAEAIAAMRKSGQIADGATVRVADVGTGSGCLAVTIAKQLPEATVTAIDISPDALAVAKRNGERHGVTDRVTFVEGDLLAPTQGEPAFDVIVSNPPYVSEAEYKTLAREVREQEPRTALVGGPTGVETIARLVPQACERLAPGGRVMIELSPMIAEAAHKLFDDAQWVDVAIKKDLAGLARIVVARKRA